MDIIIIVNIIIIININNDNIKLDKFTSDDYDV